jgi:imidazolonepropionase-like amidohydrolase
MAGVGDQLRRGNLLIVGSKIQRISPDPISAPPDSDSLDGDGRVLMPGLTDVHWHMMFAPNTRENLEMADPGLMYANAVAEQTLLRGFTTVRDIGVASFGVKAAIDSGVIPGPRVYPSGAFISQTSGHGDFAPFYA